MTRRDNTKPTLARRALSCLLTAAMVVAFTPVVAWGEGDAGAEGNGTTTSSTQDPVETVTISFNSTRGSGTMAPMEVPKGSKVVLPECYFNAPEGEVFSHWLIGLNSYKPGDSIELSADSSDISLNAIWGGNPASSYSIEYDLAGGSFGSPEHPASYTPGIWAALPTNVTREGYTFAGWIREEGSAPLFMISSRMEGNLVLKASWNSGSPAVSASTDSLSFETAIYEYEVPGSKAFTISGQTDKLTVSKSRYFDIGWGAVASADSENSTLSSFCVAPKAGLNAGAYSEVIAISKATEWNGDGTVITAIPQTYITVSFTVEKATPTIAIEPESATAKPEKSVELRISSSGLPEGATYEFQYEGTVLKPGISDNGNGVFTLYVPAREGKYVLLAVYDGDANHDRAEAYCTITVIDDDEQYWGSSIKDLEAETTVDVAGEQALKVRYHGLLQQVEVPTLGINVQKACEEGNSELMLDFSGLGSTVAHTVFTTSTIKNIADIASDPSSNMNGMSLKMSNGSVGLNGKALSSIASQLSGDDVTISVEKTKLTSLSPPQQKALKKFPALGACYEVSVTSGDKEIHDLGDGSASITLSNEGEPVYNANLSFELPMEPIMVHADFEGNIEYGDSEVQEIDGKQYLATWRNHFSVYAIVYVQPAEATKAAVAALQALPQAGELKTASAKAAVKTAKAALKQVASFDEEQRAVVSKALVANAQEVVERGGELVAKADEKAVGKVRDKVFSVKAGSSKSIAFKTRASAAGTKVTYAKAKGSKYISVTKSGKVTAKKGMRPGKTYTAKLKVTCGKAVEYVKVKVRAR